MAALDRANNALFGRAFRTATTRGRSGSGPRQRRMSDETGGWAAGLVRPARMPAGHRTHPDEPRRGDRARGDRVGSVAGSGPDPDWDSSMALEVDRPGPLPAWSGPHLDRGSVMIRTGDEEERVESGEGRSSEMADAMPAVRPSSTDWSQESVSREGRGALRQERGGARRVAERDGAGALSPGSRSGWQGQGRSGLDVGHGVGGPAEMTGEHRGWSRESGERSFWSGEQGDGQGVPDRAPGLGTARHELGERYDQGESGETKGRLAFARVAAREGDGRGRGAADQGPRKIPRSRSRLDLGRGDGWGGRGVRRRKGGGLSSAEGGVALRRDAGPRSDRGAMPSPPFGRGAGTRAGSHRVRAVGDRKPAGGGPPSSRPVRPDSEDEGPRTPLDNALSGGKDDRGEAGRK